MAVNVTYHQVGNYAVLPEDVSFGTGGGNLSFQVNTGTKVTDVELTRRSITFTLKGIPVGVLATFEAARVTAINSLINGVGGTTLSYGGVSVTNAVLRNVNPRKVIVVNGKSLADVELEYVSMDFS